jgi:hypothetical protein
MRPTLFDLESDPNEQIDIATLTTSKDICQRFEQAMTQWALKHHNRITISDADIQNNAGREVEAGILIGYWDNLDLQRALDKGKDL